MPLVIKPPRRQSTVQQSEVTGVADPRQTGQTTSRSQSPEAPPISPLTPTARRGSFLGDAGTAIGNRTGAQSGLNHQIPPAPVFIDQPPSLPFSGEDATDAIALRAAISSLQFQKQRAERDIRTLQNIKKSAIARPDEFKEHVVRTALAQQGQSTVSFNHSREYVTNSDDSEGTGTKGAEDRDDLITKTSSFADIPQPQEVVRCPPINWSKYHIVGEPLDRMHNVQRRTAGDTSMTPRSETRIAAAYDPHLDPMHGVEQSNGANAGTDRRKDSGIMAGQKSKGIRSPVKGATKR